MAERLKILLANDDGIHAKGIRTMAQTLCREHDVYVVAPQFEQSAMGHALTLHKPLRVDEVNMELPVKAAYSVAGTPSDCVKIALNAVLGFRPDIVVSGINHGPNLGVDVLYSGTVSAALEGAMNDLPSMAFSLFNGYDKQADFLPGAEYALKLIPMLKDADHPQKTIFNVNIPPVQAHEIIGVKVTELGMRMYTDTYEKRVDPRGGVYYWLAGEIMDSEVADTSDVEAIRNNYISVTPVHFDMTNYKVIETLKPRLGHA